MKRGVRQAIREVVMLSGSIALVVGVLSGAAAVTPAHASTGVERRPLNTTALAQASITLTPRLPVVMVKTKQVVIPSVTILKVRVVNPPADYGGSPPAQLAPWVDPPPQMLPWPQ